MAFDVRNYASSQPARNNERASDSSLGARIAISWQDEALELSQPVRDKKVVARFASVSRWTGCVPYTVTELPNVFVLTCCIQ
jgi:hypothetical protein